MGSHGICSQKHRNTHTQSTMWLAICKASTVFFEEWVLHRQWFLEHTARKLAHLYPSNQHFPIKNFTLHANFSLHPSLPLHTVYLPPSSSLNRTSDCAPAPSRVLAAPSQGDQPPRILVTVILHFIIGGIRRKLRERRRRTMRWGEERRRENRKEEGERHFSLASIYVHLNTLNFFLP